MKSHRFLLIFLALFLAQPTLALTKKSTKPKAQESSSLLSPYLIGGLTTTVLGIGFFAWMKLRSSLATKQNEIPLAPQSKEFPSFPTNDSASDKVMTEQTDNQKISTEPNTKTVTPEHPIIPTDILIPSSESPTSPPQLSEKPASSDVTTPKEEIFNNTSSVVADNVTLPTTVPSSEKITKEELIENHPLAFAEKTNSAAISINSESRDDDHVSFVIDTKRHDTSLGLGDVLNVIDAHTESDHAHSAVPNGETYKATTPQDIAELDAFISQQQISTIRENTSTSISHAKKISENIAKAPEDIKWFYSQVTQISRTNSPLSEEQQACFNELLQCLNEMELLALANQKYPQLGSSIKNQLETLAKISNNTSSNTTGS